MYINAIIIHYILVASEVLFTKCFVLNYVSIIHVINSGVCLTNQEVERLVRTHFLSVSKINSSWNICSLSYT